MLQERLGTKTIFKKKHPKQQHKSFSFMNSRISCKSCVTKCKYSDWSVGLGTAMSKSLGLGRLTSLDCVCLHNISCPSLKFFQIQYSLTDFYYSFIYCIYMFFFVISLRTKVMYNSVLWSIFVQYN